MSEEEMPEATARDRGAARMRDMLAKMLESKGKDPLLPYRAAAKIEMGDAGWDNVNSLLVHDFIITLSPEVQKAVWEDVKNVNRVVAIAGDLPGIIKSVTELAKKVGVPEENIRAIFERFDMSMPGSAEETPKEDAPVDWDKTRPAP